MQTLKITKIETASGVKDNKPWTRYDVTGINGKTNKPITASTFDEIDFQEGDTIEADVVISGQYSKLKSFRTIQPGQQAQIPSTSTKTQPQTSNTPHPSNSPTPISGAEKGMIIKEIGDNFRAGLFTQGSQPDVWEYYRSELSRVSGVRIN